MNGVSRFLSRRERHHEKRQSKHARSKVRPPSFLSSTSSLHALSSVDGAVEGELSMRRCRRHPNNIQSLYHKLPSILRPSSPDNFLFLRKKSPCANISSFYIQLSTIDSSDNLTLQSRQSVPTDLSTIFSNEELKTTEKDDEKKVRRHRAETLDRLLKKDRSKHLSNGFKLPESQVLERHRPNMLSRGIPKTQIRRTTCSYSQTIHSRVY